MLAEINGIKMYYQEKGEGPPLIFVHGLGENADCWRFQTEVFSASFRTISLDQRGHHRTEDGNETITLEHLRNDIIGLMDYLGIDKAHFVGHSMGGKVVQDIVAHHEDRFLSMTLCSTCADFGDGTQYVKPRLERIDTLTMEQLGAAIAKLACHPDFPERKPEVYQEIISVLQANRKEPYRQCTSIIADPRCDHRIALTKVKVPTLILVGDEDQTTPVSDAQFLNRLIRGSFLVLIPDAAHMINMENPAAVNQALAHFLAALEPEACKAVLQKLRSA